MIHKDSSSNSNSSQTPKEDTDSGWEAFLGYETPQCLVMNRASDPTHTARGKATHRRPRRPRSGSLTHSSRTSTCSGGSPSIGQRQLLQATVAVPPAARAAAERQRQQRRKSTGGALANTTTTTTTTSNNKSLLMNDSTSRRRIRIGSSCSTRQQKHLPKQANTLALDRLSLFSNAMGAISDRALAPVEPPMLMSATTPRSRKQGIPLATGSPRDTKTTRTRRIRRGSSTTRGDSTATRLSPPLPQSHPQQQHQQHQRKRISERVGRVSRNTIGAVRKGSIMSRRLSSN